MSVHHGHNAGPQTAPCVRTCSDHMPDHMTIVMLVGQNLFHSVMMYVIWKSRREKSVYFYFTYKIRFDFLKKSNLTLCGSLNPM